MQGPEVTTKAAKTFFNEIEAAKNLGISVEEFRVALKRYIVDRDEDLQNAAMTTFHPSDILLLRLMLHKRIAPTPSTA